MIIHKLILHHLGHRDDAEFYRLQAEDAIRWIERQGINAGAGVRALDLGCGHGVFGAALVDRGCSVVFADESNFLLPDLCGRDFRAINLDREPVSGLGEFDLVICSNVLEHLSRPDQFIGELHRLLKPGGVMYLSWTNWLSPWGGHEFSPFHYLGSRRGHLIYDRLIGKPRKHTPYQNLFPTSIGSVLHKISARSDLRVLKVAPRYYPEFAVLMRIPLVREFLAWNAAVLIRRSAGD